MIIDGKKIAEEIQQEIKQTIASYSGRPPCLAVVIVGHHPPSQIYVNRKAQACKQVGISSLKEELKETISETELLQKIEELNANPLVDGILVQLPLPPHINVARMTHHIHPSKDVDGFHPYNIGKLLIGEKDGFIPCTPLGIKHLLERSGIEISGKHVLVIGRSNIVGKPIAALLMQNAPGANATVTIAHRHSTTLYPLSLLADVIIVAVGQAKFLKAEMVKEGAVVIDVGINKVIDPMKKSGFQVVGDADFDSLIRKCSFITPVPGGVGPMTIAMLLHNTLLSYQKRLLF